MCINSAHAHARFQSLSFTILSMAVLSRSVEPKFNERGSAHRSTPIRPKLTLNKFEGDITTWTSFWDAYESAVHNNAALSDVDKFTYLKSLVGRSAKDAIEGLPLTVANYKEAVSILQKRFGNKQLIISRHMDILLSVEAVTVIQDVSALRRMYDKI